jgi:photosystem II stability/assembly factor-like uncharacterized protein
MTLSKKKLFLAVLISVLAFGDGFDLLKKQNLWRSIGPFRGGRSTAVAGVPSQPNVFYFGCTGGGVWKTYDSGLTWEPISDKDFTTGSVGAIAVADSDPNVVYVGMGEEAIRGNISYGDGMYKSTDAGKTWKKIGLSDTQQISRIRIHPKNPELVYVAVEGHAWGPSEERGVFRSNDGGKTWKKILYKGPRAGAIDLTFDPSNANILYAATWEVWRNPWHLESGGPGSGIWKSTDGGDTWTDLSHAQGLPKGVEGRIGLAVSPVNPDRVWASVEAEDGGIFRSDNAGRTWTKTNEGRNLRQRAWYYSRIYADPKNAERVYVLNVQFHRSNDGGRTFSTIGQPHGDNHDMWIAPDDPDRFIESNDGGANVTQNGGKSWTPSTSQPTAQFYRVALDNDFPYNIYGAQQDNTTVRIASRTTEGSIDERAWFEVGGGESGWIAPLPSDPNIVFAGSYGGLVTRYDHHTGQLRNVTPWPDNPMGHPAGDLKERFQWTFPLLFSPHAPTTLYAASQRLFKSTDEGKSWTVISPDLTTNEKSRQATSGGPITKDNTSIEYYCTIFTVAESPVKKGVIWTGSDDGLVQVTQNGGESWSNVTPKDMPQWIMVNTVEASPYDPGTAYVAATNYKNDDNRPYLYKTTDYGKNWTRIDQLGKTGGIPNGAFTRVIREDPNYKGTLYVGTETGVYVSFDNGATWRSLNFNLPVVPIHDLAIHKAEKQLVAATHGRSFWILDDLDLVHQSATAPADDVHLFQPADAYRMPGGGFRLPGAATVGQNPAAGVTVYYNLKSKPAGEMTIEFLDSTGAVVRKFSTKDTPGPGRGGEGGGEAAAEEEGFGRGGAPARIPTETGLNRFTWNMHQGDASRFPGLVMWAGSVNGPAAAPGAYSVRLTVDGKTYTEKFTIKKDPRLKFSDTDYAAQLKLGLEIRDKLSAIHDGITKIRDARKQVDDLTARWKDDPAGKKIVDAGKALNDKMKAVEEALYQTKNQSSQDPLNFPIRLNNRLAALGGVVAEGDGAPTAQDYVVFKELTLEIDPQLAKLDEIMKKDLEEFNKTVRDANVPAVLVKDKK